MRGEGVIFILENSTDYLFSLDQAFRKAQLMNPLRIARYGNEAILYLKGVGIYSDRRHYPLPRLIILDLSIPDGSGLAVLGWIRRQPEFDRTPVIILVNPAQNRFLQETFDKTSNAHYVKRDDFEALAHTIREIESGTEKAAAPSEGDGNGAEPAGPQAVHARRSISAH